MKSAKPSASPRILITNDDGINAPGLKALERIAKKISDDVWVVAPETEQSGTGHSLTLHVPLRIRKLSARRFAISGTPTDAVLLALHKIIPNKKRVSLVLSGVNRGSNTADDVTYSGTIAAAMEGTLLGVPSIALSASATAERVADWKVAEHYAPALIRQLWLQGWPEWTLINLNFPNVPVKQVKGLRFCPQANRKIGEKIEMRTDPKGREYYWIGFDYHRDRHHNQPGTDITCLREGYVTVTPLCMDLTDYKTMEKLRLSFERTAKSK